MTWPFKKHYKSFLGIDVGTSVIKVVELSKHGDQEKLENYVSVPILSPDESPAKTNQKSSLVLAPREVSDILNLITKEAKIKASKAFFSIPDFATFFTTFPLPQMSKEEIEQAIRFEARRHVPLPLSEVTLGWKVIRGKLSNVKKGEIEILLVVVPNVVINQYTSIAEFSQLELLSLEAEVFGLSRALVKDAEKTIALIDIGAQSTTCSIVDKNILKVSHSFDTAGNALTERIIGSLNVDRKTAETLKQNKGLLKSEKENIKEILVPIIDLVLSEIKKVADNFYQSQGKEIDSYVFSGGTSLLPGLKEYSIRFLKKDIELAQPFSKMAYSPILEDNLKQAGPIFAIAVGMALKGLE
ncbi:MAG: type IV pilus assembly protein PilM [Candidatus Pacebacteria bacterium]|nr:type IV pilus assembly protein PilM [Candidatus Paceibacterota bacterium]